MVSTASAAGPSAHHGGDARRHDQHAAVLQFVDPAVEPLGEHVAAEQFGHRAAAGVARADEQHHQAGQPLQGSLGHDARAKNLVAPPWPPGPPTTAGRSGTARRPPPGRARRRRCRDFLGGDGLGHSARGWRWSRPTARPASAARRASPDGPARAGRSPAAGETACRTFGGSCRTRLSGCESSTTSVTGPGQHRRASRRAKGHMSGA